MNERCSRPRPSARSEGNRPVTTNGSPEGPSPQSRRGLDWLNFFMADVQTGFGSFLSFYLADRGWSQENVGFVLTAGGLSGVVAQIPGGALVDVMRSKRLLVAIGVLMIAASAGLLALTTDLPGYLPPKCCTALRAASSDRRSEPSAWASSDAAPCRAGSAAISASMPPETH